MTKRLATMFLLFITSFGADSKNVDQALLTGVAIQSFDDSQYVIQTDRYFFRVEKSKLSSDVRAELDRSVEASQRRSFTIPHQAVSYTWPVLSLRDDEINRSHTLLETKQSGEIREHVTRGAEDVEIAGTIAMSFQESHYIVLSNGNLYLILKSSLSEKQNTRLSQANIGERVEISLKNNALQLAGRFSGAVDSAKFANKTEPESATIYGGGLTISGVVIHSFSDQHVIVRAHQTYFLLTRSMVEDPVSPKLDMPGSFVKISAPLAAVYFVWTTATNEMGLPARYPE